MDVVLNTTTLLLPFLLSAQPVNTDGSKTHGPLNPMKGLIFLSLQFLHIKGNFCLWPSSV